MATAQPHYKTDIRLGSGSYKVTDFFPSPPVADSKCDELCERHVYANASFLLDKGFLYIGLNRLVIFVSLFQVLESLACSIVFFFYMAQDL